MEAVSQNPHKNLLRNLKKKAESISALKDRDDLDAAQKEKLRTEKKVLAELATAEKKYKEWEAANAAAVKEAPKKTEAKKQANGQKADKKQAEKKEKKEEAKADDAQATEHANKLRNLTKKLRAVEELEAKVAAGHAPDKAQKEKLATKKEIKKQIAEVEKLMGGKPAAKEKKEEQPKPKPAAKKETKKEAKKEAAKETPKDDAPQMDPKVEKTTRNRLKNLKGKLDSIAALKKADAELTDEQVAKVKSEKKIKAEIDELTKKLTAFGLSA